MGLLAAIPVYAQVLHGLRQMQFNPVEVGDSWRDLRIRSWGGRRGQAGARSFPAFARRLR